MTRLTPINRLRSAKTAGSKAYSLQKLQRAGLRIPESWAIDFAAWNEYRKDPDAVLLSLEEALRVLPEDRLYAVRSSASLEDDAERSFAGQYRSFLQVSGRDGLLQAVQGVWDSARDPELTRYLGGGTETDVQMGVIVQEQIDGVYSGVLFTRNPLTGGAEMIVEMVAGSGEGLVQDGKTPLRYVDKWGLWTETPVAGSEETRAIAETVRDEALRFRKRFPGDWDLEWVWDGGALYWVQARPITGLEKLRYYSSRASREFLPGMISPLVWSTNTPLVNGAWQTILTRLVGRRSDIRTDALTKAFYYRAYFNMGLIGDVLETLGLPRETLELLRGNERPGPRRPRFRPTFRSLPHVPRVFSFLREVRSFPKEASAYLDGNRERFRRRLEEVSRQLPDLSDREILEVIDGLTEDMHPAAYYNVMTPLIRNARTAMLRKQMKRAGIRFEGLVPPRGHFEQLREDDPTVRMRELSILRQEQGPESPAYRDGLKRFVNIFGHLSANNNDFSVASWQEDLPALDALIAQVPDVPSGSVPEMGNNRRLKTLYDRAVSLSLLKEKISAHYLRGYRLYRSCYLELGRRWTEAGWFQKPEDVFFLYRDELAGSHNDWAEKIKERREEFQAYRDLILPVEIIGEDPPPPITEVSHQFSGVPVSKGVFRGPVKVLRSPDDAQVSASDVVVIPYADISWTPVLIRAGAILSESGGMLSHSAIVAREFRIPAVVSVPDVMAISPGAVVTVDGSTGNILIEDRN